MRFVLGLVITSALHLTQYSKELHEVFQLFNGRIVCRLLNSNKDEKFCLHASVVQNCKSLMIYPLWGCVL